MLYIRFNFFNHEIEPLLSLNNNFLLLILIIIALLTRHYLTNMNISDEGSTCEDINNSDDEGTND